MEDRWHDDHTAIDPRIATASAVSTSGSPRAGRLGRRVVLAVLLVVVVLAAGGLLGVRTSSVSASRDGYAMTVTYALIARAGLDVPWRVTVEHSGGFDENIVIAVSARYFDGPTFSVDYDAYIQPARQLSEGADVVLMVADRPMLSVSYTTWLVP